MSTTDTRAAFEQAMLREDILDEEVLMAFDGKNYADDTANTAYKSWQAATESAKPAAQDSAPAELPTTSIKTWQERFCECYGINPGASDEDGRGVDEMLAEIADLRAALAAAPASPQPEKQRPGHCPNCGANGEHICPAGSRS